MTVYLTVKIKCIQQQTDAFTVKLTVFLTVSLTDILVAAQCGGYYVQNQRRFNLNKRTTENWFKVMLRTFCVRK